MALSNASADSPRRGMAVDAMVPHESARVVVVAPNRTSSPMPSEVASRSSRGRSGPSPTTAQGVSVPAEQRPRRGFPTVDWFLRGSKVPTVIGRARVGYHSVSLRHGHEVRDGFGGQARVHRQSFLELLREVRHVAMPSGLICSP